MYIKCKVWEEDGYHLVEIEGFNVVTQGLSWRDALDMAVDALISLAFDEDEYEAAEKYFEIRRDESALVVEDEYALEKLEKLKEDRASNG